MADTNQIITRILSNPNSTDEDRLNATYGRRTTPTGVMGNPNLNIDPNESFKGTTTSTVDMNAIMQGNPNAYGLNGTTAGKTYDLLIFDKDKNGKKIPELDSNGKIIPQKYQQTNTTFTDKTDLERAWKEQQQDLFSVQQETDPFTVGASASLTIPFGNANNQSAIDQIIATNRDKLNEAINAQKGYSPEQLQGIQDANSQTLTNARNQAGWSNPSARQTLMGMVRPNESFGGLGESLITPTYTPRPLVAAFKSPKLDDIPLPTFDTVSFSNTTTGKPQPPQRTSTNTVSAWAFTAPATTVSLNNLTTAADPSNFVTWIVQIDNLMKKNQDYMNARKDAFNSVTNDTDVGKAKKACTIMGTTGIAIFGTDAQRKSQGLSNQKQGMTSQAQNYYKLLVGKFADSLKNVSFTTLQTFLTSKTGSGSNVTSSNRGDFIANLARKFALDKMCREAQQNDEAIVGLPKDFLK